MTTVLMIDDVDNIDSITYIYIYVYIIELIG